MTKLILGIDAGNYQAKVCGVHGSDSFKTNLSSWKERHIIERFGDDDMEYEIDNKRGFAGSLAEAEDEFGTGAMFGETKAHHDTKIRVLLAIHRYLRKYELTDTDIYIVTGQPISKHNEDEKTKIIHMLKGKHEYSVKDADGIESHRKINIKDVKVTPEGSGAFWSNPQPGLVRIVDIGSGTVNMATISEKRHLAKASDTMDTGMETLKNKQDVEGMARGIIQATTKLKWKPTDTLMVCGGIAEKLVPHLQHHYTFATVLKPQLKRESDTITLQPAYANAVAFYNLAKGVYS